MRFLVLVPLLLCGLGCAHSPHKPPVAHPDNGARITVGDMLGGCNQLTKQVRPVYPEEAKQKRVQGTVHLQAVITKTGELADITLLRGDPLLLPAALAAVRQWRYTPCVLNSETLEVRVPIDVDFNLNQ